MIKRISGALQLERMVGQAVTITHGGETTVVRIVGIADGDVRLSIEPVGFETGFIAIGSAKIMHRGESMRIHVVDIKGGYVKLNFSGPRSFVVLRSELTRNSN